LHFPKERDAMRYDFGFQAPFPLLFWPKAKL
jgi:hypothetical protein